jgi:hypothetical protein
MLPSRFSRQQRQHSQFCDQIGGCSCPMVRPSTVDIEAMPQLVVHLGQQVHAELHSFITMVNQFAPTES